MKTISNEEIFSVLRIIKEGNPGDLYYEAYLGHLAKRGTTFFDLYHFNRAWAVEHAPKTILEIGTRTGISMCQLLSAYIDSSVIQRVVCCDLFNDGFISPELVRFNLRLVGVPETTVQKVEFLVGDSKSTVTGLTETEKFDYILVDGDHSKEGARVDLTNARRLVAQGGVIAFDDIAPDGMDLLDVWNSFKSQHATEFEWHEDMNGKGLGWAIKL